MLATNSLSSRLSLLHLRPRDSLASYRILVNSFFLLALHRSYSVVFQPRCFWWTVSRPMDPCSPTCKTASPLLLSAFHLHLYVREAWLWRGSVSFSFILPCLRLAEFLGCVNWCFTQNLRKKESQTLWEFDKYFWLHSVFMALLPTVLSHVFCISSSKYNAWFHTSVLLLRFLLEMTILPACYQLTSATRSH